MSSSAATVKPPIQLFGLEGRYATALYTAATKLNQLDSVEKELTQVQSAMKQKPKLREAIISPIINRKVMEATIVEVGKAANLAAATTNLLKLLAENGRMKKLDGVINAFKQLMAAHRGEVVCEIKTARPLNDAQRKTLQGVLSVSEFDVYFDPSLWTLCANTEQFNIFSIHSEICQAKRNHSVEGDRRHDHHWWNGCIDR